MSVYNYIYMYVSNLVRFWNSRELVFRKFTEFGRMRLEAYTDVNDVVIEKL